MDTLRNKLNQASDIEMAFMMLGICTLLAIPLLVLGLYFVVGGIVVLCPVLIAIVTTETDKPINLVEEIDDWRKSQEGGDGPPASE